jgi:NADH oxidase (H2O2-forming)
LTSSSSAADPPGRVIVHAFHARPDAAAGRSLVIVKNEPINVNRCAVPYGIPEGKPLDRFDIPNALVTDFGAELIVDDARAIELDGKTATLGSGEIIAWNTLVLATGSSPIIPPIPGVDASNVTSVRSRDDLARLRDWAGRTGARAAVIGGGYIGVEVAVVLRQLGVEVALVEMLPHVLEASTEPEFLPDLEADLRQAGIDLATGRTVSRFEIDETSRRATAVVLDGGDALPIDFIVLATGVRPNTQLAADAGLGVSPLGIVVDEHLRTSHPDVYASGDCAEKRSFITGRPTRGEFGTNAVFMSRVIARNLLGENATFPGVINAAATTTANLSVGSAGLTERQARDAGLDVVAGASEVLDRYPMMDGRGVIRTKLIFERETGRFVGGSVLRPGHAVAANVDLLSFAIQKRATIGDFIDLQYATHPELAAKPSDNSLLFAAQEARKQLVRREPAAIA